MRLRSNTQNQTPRTSPPDESQPHHPRLNDHIQQLREQLSFSSASTSRQTSNTSIHSMPFHPQMSRHSTPPTPMSSPGLFRPPSPPPPPSTSATTTAAAAADAPADSGRPLHFTQYHTVDPVRETKELETDYDPVTGIKTINNYSIIDEIGRGTHGKVKLGFDLRSRDLVAIKIVERSQGRPRLGRKGQGGESSETKIRREIAILKKIRHENVVRLLEVIDDDRSKKVYLVLEYVVRGEVNWRKDGDPDVLRRDRLRLKLETAEARAKIAALTAATASRSTTPSNNNNSNSNSVGNASSRRSPARRKERRRRDNKTNFWSLEFASDSNADSGAEDSSHPAGTANDDASDSESALSILEEECYGPAMEIEDARRCFRDTVVGLDHLHWNGIIHRDIKPANLLWTDNKATKISDFGVSFLGRPIREEDDDGTGEDEPTGYEQDEKELAKTAGTPAFFAPELCSMGSSPPNLLSQTAANRRVPKKMLRCRRPLSLRRSMSGPSASPYSASSLADYHSMPTMNSNCLNALPRKSLSSLAGVFGQPSPNARPTTVFRPKSWKSTKPSRSMTSSETSSNAC